MVAEVEFDAVDEEEEEDDEFVDEEEEVTLLLYDHTKYDQPLP